MINCSVNLEEREDAKKLWIQLCKDVNQIGSEEKKVE